MPNSTRISAVSYRVPENRLTHDEMRARFGTEIADKISESSGILERRVCAPGECASDLAARAAEDLIEAFSVERNSIDLLINATQTPDYLLPTTACLLQDKLRLPTSAAAFDINLGCSQYIYGMAVAHSMLGAGLAKKALVLTGDTVSRIIHPSDRAVVPLFGDAGTATLLEPSEEHEGFLNFELGTDGSGGRFLIWPTSGLREPRTSQSAEEHDDGTGAVRTRNDMFMDGASVFLFTLKTIPPLITRLLAKRQLAIADVDLFVFHQASELIVNASAKKLGIPAEKLHFKLHDVGNSGGSTVAVALPDALLAGRITPGMTIVLAAFGVGLSWGAALIKWPAQGVLGAVSLNDFTGSPPVPKRQRVDV